MNKILMGSVYFFSEYEDFHSKDIDYVMVVETDEWQYLSQLRSKEKDIFRLKKQPTVDIYINMAVDTGLGMTVGKFLIPEFCEEIGLTIEDLPKLKPLIDILDEKHLYEKIIYDAYIENHAFMLTSPQRDLAYKTYKEKRMTTNE